jgi:LAS superfamily LD-carboxypeptidase LdcB
MNKHPILWLSILGILFVLAAGAFAYQKHEYDKVSEKLVEKENEFASSTADFNSQIQALNENIEELKSENGELSQKLESTDKKVGQLEKDKRANTKTISTLEKLTTYDPQLLQKYSKVYFLNENYSPPELTIIPQEYTYNPAINYEFHAQVFPFLKKMLDTAMKEGIEMNVISAYRSFGTQAALKNSYKVTYGAGTANQFSADQGYSEHQLGTTIDLSTPSTGANYEGFGNTSAYLWLVDNAHKYGFILSYPKGNNYYISEPWHWRFVGRDLAEYLHDNKINFYDLDQREINKYLVEFFD